jgi:CBS domain-containing protein
MKAPERVLLDFGCNSRQKGILEINSGKEPQNVLPLRVCEAMTRALRVCHPEQSIHDCARMMVENDVGALPVGEHGRLVGIITDRDIAVRAVAARRAPDTPVCEVMTKEVLSCLEEEELDHIAARMAEARVRRVPVVDREERLVGILSLGDVALKHDPETAARTVWAVSRPGGPHSQSEAHGA